MATETFDRTPPFAKITEILAHNCGNLTVVAARGFRHTLHVPKVSQSPEFCSEFCS